MSKEKMDPIEFQATLQKIFEDLKKCDRIIIWGMGDEDNVLAGMGMSYIEIIGALEDMKMTVMHKHRHEVASELLNTLKDATRDLKDCQEATH